MQTQRSRLPRSPPIISKPIPVEDYVPVSPPMTPPRQRGGSISSPINWLSRTTSSSGHSAPYAPSKPVRISEPKFLNAFDSLTQQRGGVLGSGATVVRTPQEALAGPRGQSPFHADVEDDDESVEQDDSSIYRHPARPESPPLPPIPDAESPICCESQRSRTPPRPTRPPPAAPDSPASVFTELESSSPQSAVTTLRPSIKSRSPPSSEYSPPVPALPANISCSPPQAPFEPILLSALPESMIDPSKVIVSLETSTTTHRTTLNTLTSRSSFLATYLQELLPAPPRRRDSDAESLHSDVSEATTSFNSIFHHHLASSGLLSQTSTSIHIFLDRPSAPYAHILSYLRSPPSTPENPALLPRAVQLSSSSSARLEALLELRDEARYLDLDELYKLCNDEIRLRTVRPAGLGLHVRGFSSASTTSLRSVTTLRDIAEYETKSGRAQSRDSEFASAGAMKKPKVQTGVRPLADPQQRGRTTTRKVGIDSVRAKLNPGWL